MIRPLATAIIEYGLLILVLKRGKSYKKIIALLLFFLATYQLGEVIIFITNGKSIGFQIAYFSTTLLPPLGIFLIQKITKKQYGGLLFQAIAILFSITFLLDFNLVKEFTISDYCIQVESYNSELGSIWTMWYQGTLFYTMGLIIWNLVKNKFSKKIKKELSLLLIAYISFDFGAILIALIFPEKKPAIASIMCALAIFTAFILAYISVKNNKWE